MTQTHVPMPMTLILEVMTDADLKDMTDAFHGVFLNGVAALTGSETNQQLEAIVGSSRQTIGKKRGAADKVRHPGSSTRSCDGTRSSDSGRVE